MDCLDGTEVVELGVLVEAVVAGDAVLVVVDSADAVPGQLVVGDADSVAVDLAVADSGVAAGVVVVVVEVEACSEVEASGAVGIAVSEENFAVFCYQKASMNLSLGLCSSLLQVLRDHRNLHHFHHSLHSRRSLRIRQLQRLEHHRQLVKDCSELLVRLPHSLRLLPELWPAR